MATRLGVDIGGTFTDLIFFDEATSQVLAAKGPTTPASPDEGVGAVVDEAVPPDVLSRAGYFLHGSTVGLNALIERKGAVVGMLTTRGFRDVLELRRGDRADMFDLSWRPAPPLVPRWLRLPVTERMTAAGAVDTPLDEDDVRRACAVFGQEGVECVAVVFLNAYANPEHELAAERLLRDAGFEGEISLSHRASGEYREYERTTTTVVDAYVRPKVSDYLRRLEERLRSMRFDGNLLVSRSGGGAMTFAEAQRRPFETIMSGPVAGAVASAALCKELGISRAITADIGGTSLDTCLISDGEPHVKYEGEVDDMPLQCPWIDVRSIGAGGGSIAYVDAGGLLRVGPQSAGAMPGPASYARGGTEPTVTDAACVLGMLADGELAGGLRLDVERARAAFAPLAERLGLEIPDVARGVLRILAANIADAIRSVTVEEGQDPREAHLIPFGGAGPLFATLLARELELRTIVVPNYPGNFSAWGLLCQDVVRSGAVTAIAALDRHGLEAAAGVSSRVLRELQEQSRGAEIGGTTSFETALDLRYVGQEYTLTVPAPLEAGALDAEADAVALRFREQYFATFGLQMDEEIEIVAVRGDLRTALPRIESRAAKDGVDAALARDVEAYSFTRDEWIRFAVCERSSLADGSSAEGPLILLEPTATTYVDAGFEVAVHESGALFVTDRGGV